jgi:hypothetical protein
MLSKKLTVYIPLPFEISYERDLKFASFDVTNTYPHVSSTDLINTIELICDQRDIKVEVKIEIRRICQVLTEQNYFQFQDKPYTQKGFVTGTSTSLFSEIYLSHMETQR